MALPQYKTRDYLVQETILMLRKLIDEGVTANVSSSSGIALETTLQLIKDSLDVLETIVDSGNVNSLLKFDKDGTITTVLEDSSIPSNNAPLPVKITSTSGDINITAGDLNVQLSDTGTNYDSVRIGDGTNLLTIDSNGRLTVNIISDNKLSEYAISRTDDSTTIEYYGFVATDGRWYILKIDTTTGIYTYVNGASDLPTNWGNRAMLTYVEFDALTW